VDTPSDESSADPSDDTGAESSDESSVGLSDGTDAEPSDESSVELSEDSSEDSSDEPSDVSSADSSDESSDSPRVEGAMMAPFAANAGSVGIEISGRASSRCHVAGFFRPRAALVIHHVIVSPPQCAGMPSRHRRA
jgi:hypothetical protein